MSKTVILIRHGEAETNKKMIMSSETNKYGLTENGKQKIKETAEKIFNSFGKERNNISIYSSPVLRTKETAEIIAERFNLKVVIDNSFTEVGLGINNNRNIKDELKNKEYEELESLEEKFHSNKHPSGERWIDILERMKNGLDDILKKDNNKIIIIISHGDPLTILRNYLLRRENICLFNSKYYFEKGEFFIIEI